MKKKAKVLVFGTFDIVHAGHIHMFEQAKEYAHHLTVCVGRDSNVEKIKGNDPLHTEQERVKFLTYISVIDEVRMGYLHDPYKIIGEIKPNIIALGYDQKVYVDKLADAITDMGLSIQIVRLVSYKPDKFKGRKIKKYLERFI